MSAKIGVAVMAVLLSLYIVLVGWRAVQFIATGEPIGVMMGVALIVLPIIAVWALWRELQFGMRAQSLLRILESEDALPEEEVPTRASGRVDRAAADELFPAYAEATQEHPGDWRVWLRLSLVYDAAGDRKRARAAARQAITVSRNPNSE